MSPSVSQFLSRRRVEVDRNTRSPRTIPQKGRRPNNNNIRVQVNDKENGKHTLTHFHHHHDFTDTGPHEKQLSLPFIEGTQYCAKLLNCYSSTFQHTRRTHGCCHIAYVHDSLGPRAGHLSCSVPCLISSYLPGIMKLLFPKKPGWSKIHRAALSLSLSAWPFNARHLRRTLAFSSVLFLSCLNNPS